MNPTKSISGQVSLPHAVFGEGEGHECGNNSLEADRPDKLVSLLKKEDEKSFKARTPQNKTTVNNRNLAMNKGSQVKGGIGGKSDHININILELC